MIKELFLPEKIGTKRILSQRIIGLAIHENYVRLVLVYAKGSKTIIEKFLEAKIEEGVSETFNDRIIQPIKS